MTSAVNLTDISGLEQSPAPTEEQPVTQTFLVGSKASTFATRTSTEVCYHSVGGRETWGIIWDPGAADGLMGTHTLLEYARAFLYPLGLTFGTMGDQGGKNFAGIDGKPLPSKMRVTCLSG